MTASPAALRLSGVEAGYGSHVAITDISLEVAPGACVGLVGPNGAGKSTLFRVALGAAAPWKGTVELLGMPARKLDRRRQPVAFVPQARNLDRSFPVSAKDVVMMGRLGRRGRFQRLNDTDREAVDEALDQVGLTHKAENQFGTLSGGEQQRILVGRALASQARLLMMDEPFAGVDVPSQLLLSSVIEHLREQGVTLVISTHDLSVENLERFDRIVCLNRSIVAEGTAEEVTSLDVWRLLFSGPGVHHGVA